MCNIYMGDTDVRYLLHHACEMHSSTTHLSKPHNFHARNRTNQDGLPSDLGKSRLWVSSVPPLAGLVQEKYHNAVSNGSRYIVSVEEGRDNIHGTYAMGKKNNSASMPRVRKTCWNTGIYEKKLHKLHQLHGGEKP